jgi:DNA-binding NarL/FixJ family response regulator
MNLSTRPVNLSPRQKQILEYAKVGKSNKEIAHSLGITEQTVKNHMTSLFRKMDVTNRTQAVMFALQRGLLQLW